LGYTFSTGYLKSIIIKTKAYWKGYNGQWFYDGEIISFNHVCLLRPRNLADVLILLVLIKTKKWIVGHRENGIK
jgi:hypothetical protein